MRWWSIRIATVCGTLLALFAASRFLYADIQEYVFGIVILCGIYMSLAVSLNLINGVTGQFSIGHAGFYGVGAYVGASWTKLWQPHFVTSMPFLAFGTLHGDCINLVIALLLGATAAGLTGIVVGLPSLRLRGDYLAIVTLGFGEVIRIIILNLNAVGGPRGMENIRPLLRTGHLEAFWVFLVLAIAIAISRNLLQSVRGLTWLAVREDEIAADAMGVDTTRVKVTAFAIGSALAGAAGVLYAHLVTGISPDSFDMNKSITIATMVVLGGTGSITGSLVAAGLLTALPEVLQSLKQYQMVSYSTLLIVMMLTRPQGIFGHREFGWKTLRRLLQRHKAAEQVGPT